MNITRAVALLINATLAPETFCDMCGGHDGHGGNDGHEGHGGEGGHGGMGDMGGHDMSGMMSMAFHFGHTETVLFKDWNFDTVGGLVGSAVGVFFMGIFYEAFKYGRTIVETKMRPSCKGAKPTMFNVPHVIQTFMHAIQYTLSYFLMFIFMTYNVWLCIAVVLGGTVGYFLFGWRKSAEKDLDDCCP